MKIVYVCSPYRNNVENNIYNACLFCNFVVKQGFCPIAPHLFFPQFLNDNIETERNKGLELNKNFLNIADELWIFGKNITDGMSQELKYFKTLNKTIKFFDYDNKNNKIKRRI